MTAIRQPRSLPAATALCERFAELDGQIAGIEGQRQDDIAAINARADTAANDLIAERNTIAAKVELWWAGAAASLTKGKRKSIELGGCTIGSRSGRAKLKLVDKEVTIIVRLKALRAAWATKLLREKWTLDRTAAMKALEGKNAAKLKDLGVERDEPGETFFIERAEQAGTLAGQD